MPRPDDAEEKDALMSRPEVTPGTEANQPRPKVFYLAVFAAVALGVAVVVSFFLASNFFSRPSENNRAECPPTSSSVNERRATTPPSAVMIPANDDDGEFLFGGNDFDPKTRRACVTAFGLLPGYFNSKDEFVLFGTPQAARESPISAPYEEAFTLPCDLPIRVRSKPKESWELVRKMMEGRNFLFFGNSVIRAMQMHVAREMNLTKLMGREVEKKFCDTNIHNKGLCQLGHGEDHDPDTALTLFFVWYQWFANPRTELDTTSKYMHDGGVQDSCFGNPSFLNCTRKLIDNVNASTFHHGVSSRDVLFVIIGHHYPEMGMPRAEDRADFVRVLKQVFPGTILFLNPCQLVPEHKKLGIIIEETRRQMGGRLIMIDLQTHCKLHYNWYDDYIHQSGRLTEAHLDLMYSVLWYIMRR